MVDLLSLLPTIRSGVEQAWKWRRGKALAEKESQEELAQALELSVRLCGSVLFELRSNVERIRLMAKHSQERAVTFGTFDLSISDALMPQLCEVLPTPVVLGEFHLALSAIRRADFYQRAGATAPMVPVDDDVLGPRHEEDTRGFARAIAFAQDALAKGLVDRFNRLRAMSAGIGQAAFGSAWATVEASFLPTAVDETAEIEQGLV